eukprot:SAG22_NODE_1265_length_4958_cov_61.157440_6_plen_38_part_01
MTCAGGQLMELVGLFPETQQFLKKTESNDRSAPQLFGA